MVITILSQYYPPETGAPQNRLHSLAKVLSSKGVEVKVITAMPNYPVGRVHDAYLGKLFHHEIIDGIPVWRSWIFASKSPRILPRLLSYFSFVFSCLFAGMRSGKCDILICESPPLFLGLSAMLLASLKRAKLVFNVSDLWPESAEKLDIVSDGFMLRLAYRLEAWIYRKSWLVSGQTQGIVTDIAKRFPTTRTYWLPNGVDAAFYAGIQPNHTLREQHNLAGKKLFLYAGVLGHAQGLEVIIKAAQRFKDDPRLAFVMVGDGPKKEELRELDASLQAGVHFLPHMPRNNAMELVAASYACIVPLRKLAIFEGAIPSKLFDPLALGVPILLGVKGEAKSLFIDQGNCGLAFEPEDDGELAQQIAELLDNELLHSTLAHAGREFVYQNFDRRTIATDFLQALNHNDQL
jgi:glycosyltransferase involved in cell wall biosynthesis